MQMVIVDTGRRKMKVYLNEITGMADALVSMYMSKRTWTPELDKEIRTEVLEINDRKCIPETCNEN